MSLYRADGLPDDLTSPVVIAAFDGWVDAAGASSSAAEHLASTGDQIATFDADILFDYRSRRPVLDIIDGTLTRLTWPTVGLHRVAHGGRDLLILHGAEPDFRWKELGDDVVGLCARLGVAQWVSLGAIPAAVPHTRATPVLASASADGLLRDGEVKGPPGLLRVPSACLSAIEMSIQGAGIPSVGFYAQVPHYIGGPFAPASVALLRHLSTHLQVELPIGSFEEEAEAQRARLDAAVDADDDVREILQRLEQASGDEEIPTGDELAAEIERFLRGRATGDGGGTMPTSG